MLMERTLTIDNSVCGRWFLCLIALFLMSVGMQAENYDLWVAGTQVSSDNATDVLGDGKVSWNNSSKILTLNGATINGTIVSNVTSAITIHLVGTNTITTTANQMPIQSSLSNAQDLTFTAAEGAMLLTNKTRTNGNADICSGFNFSSESDIPDGYRLSWDANEICSLAEYYDIYFYTFVNNSQYFQPYYVTAANCDKLMGTYNETSNQWDNNTIAVSYNYSQKTLTLNNAIFESAEPYNTTYFLNCDGSKAKTLTINLLGDNKFTQNSSEPNAKFATMNVYEGKFIIITDANNPGSLTSVDLYSEDSEYFNFINGEVEYKNGLGYFYAGNGTRYIRTQTTSESYDLWVAGVQVTSGNAANVFGSETPTVSFDATTNTLTLNNATVNGVVNTSIEDLTVNLVGVSTFNVETNTSTDTYLFNYTGSSSNATLTYTAENLGATVQGIGTTNNYKLEPDNYSYGNVHFDYDDAWKTYYSNRNDLCFCEVTKPYLWVVDCEINDANKNDVGIEGVTFDLANSKVTFTDYHHNNYSSNPDYFIKSNIPSLTVEVTGSSSYAYLNTQKKNNEIVSRGFYYTGASGETSSLTMVIAEGASLRLCWSGETATTDWLFEGFTQTNIETDELNIQYGTPFAQAGTPYSYEISIFNVESYDLQVAGVNVNSVNANRIVTYNDNGYVSFDAETNTLTLNDYFEQNDNGGDTFILNGIGNLTINLAGNTTLRGYAKFLTKRGQETGNYTATFKTNTSNPGCLTFYPASIAAWCEGHTIEYISGLTLSNGNDDYDYIDISSADALLMVAGIAVDESNAGDILGDGKLSFNADNNTLTLNDATLAGAIYWKSSDPLTIALKGENSITCTNGSYAIQSLAATTAPSLSFVKASGATDVKLTLSVPTEIEDPISGFGAITHQDMFMMASSSETMCTTVVSTKVFDGDGTANSPFLIKTADDLKQFTSYYNTGYFDRNSHVQLYNDINCENQTGFTTIADNSGATFCGVFDGNQKTISNLTMTGAGLFGYVEKDEDYVGTIKDLTLSNYHLTGDSWLSATGGIVAELSDGAVVSNCTVKNSTIACDPNQYNPEVGGIVARLYGSTVTGCTVNNVKLKAETSYTGGSGAASSVGGIVGNATEGTIESCVVMNGSKITNYYADESADLNAGAIIGYQYNSTFSENYYYFDVTVEMLNGTNAANKIVISGYTQRGIGGQTYNEQTQQNEDNPDLLDGNGAVMYTKKVTLPAESTQATVIGEEGTYYSTVMESDVLSILVAPGQTATLNAIPGDGLAIASLTVTNTTTSEAITTTSTMIEAGTMQYTFTMPDAPVSVAVTTATAYGISIAGVTVTELNAANILGDGTVSYNASKHTLTLNGATIGNDGSGSDPMEACGIDYSETADLTISLKGTNTIYGMGGCNAIRYNGQGDVAPKLIFTKGDDQECSLQLNTSSDYERTAISGGFSEIQGVWGVGTTDNGLAIIADKEVKYDSEDGLTIEKVVNYTVNYVPLSSTLITSYYGLAISGVPVYEGNKSNITGEGIYGNGTASFDLTTNTLTLNNVNLNPDYAQNDGDLRVSIVTSLAQLNINLIGESQTYAIKTTNESGTLTFKSAEANRGAARLNFWYNAEPYYIGFGENKVTYNDGLCLRNSSSNSSFPKVVALYVPKVVTEEKERGLYYPDHEFTFSMEEEVEGFDIYYANMLGGDPVKTTKGKFTLAEGRYTLRVYPIYPGMDTDPSKNSQFASERYAKVIAKPTFSEENGTYNESFTLTLQNVPEQDAREEWAEGLSENIMVPQVWYFINDNKNDSIRYDATKGISVTESCKVSVYVIDVDSAKKLKSTPVEAHYVIRQDAGLAYTQNNESVEVAEYTIGGANNPALPTLQNENELAVTFSSEDENVATVNAETGAVTIVGVGRTTISATSEQTDVLLAGEVSYLLTVYKDLSHESITVTVADMTYTGEAVSPEVTVMDGETDITGYVTVAYSNNVAVGSSALVTITPKTADVNYYVGSTTQTFSIVNRTLEIGKDVNFASGQKWASFYTTTENLELPDGVMAYIVTGVSTEAVTVKAINYVPKNVPVLIENESTTTTDNTSAEGNQLQGTSESTAVSAIEGHVYVLYNGGFTRATSGAIPAGRAYLVLEQEASARLLIVEEEATDISEIERMSNGGNESWYSLDGQKLQKKPTKKGMYIVNGQKVVIK